MPKHQLIAASKINWVTEVQNEGGYPGDENVKIGCLQRIASATEAMAQNYIQLQNDRDYYKRRYEQEAAACKRLVRSNNALRGVINRMKKANQ